MIWHYYDTERLNDFIVRCLGRDNFVLRRGKYLSPAERDFIMRPFCCFCFSTVACVELDKSFYIENILIIKWDDCVRGSAVRFMGIS